MLLHALLRLLDAWRQAVKNNILSTRAVTIIRDLRSSSIDARQRIKRSTPREMLPAYFDRWHPSARKSNGNILD